MYSIEPGVHDDHRHDIYVCISIYMWCAYDMYVVTIVHAMRSMYLAKSDACGFHSCLYLANSDDRDFQ